jgi:hypothetical protein
MKTVAQAVEELVRVTVQLSDADIGREWKWRVYDDEGLRFALLARLLSRPDQSSCSENLRASANSSSFGSESRPMRRISLAFEIVPRSSQFATHGWGRPSRWSRVTSDGSPRDVRVTVATVVLRRAPRTSSRAITTTGLHLSTRAHQISPCSVAFGIARSFRPILVVGRRVF